MKTIIDYKKEIVSLVQQMEKEHGGLVKSVSVFVTDEICGIEPTTGEEVSVRKYDVDINFKF